MATSNLPAGILASDLKFASYDKCQGVPFEERTFEIWHTSLGWVIPTLAIRNARNGQPRRTYAVRISDGTVCRVGMGPHVTATHTVYVTKKRYAALAPFITLRAQGLGNAGAVRDRISSRRAQGQVERALGKTSWRWNK